MSFLYIFLLSSYSDIVYVQNPSKKYMPEENFLKFLRGGVGWGLGLMLARRGDIQREGAFGESVQFASVRRCICNHSKRTVHLQQFGESVQLEEKVRSSNETRGIDSL